MDSQDNKKWEEAFIRYGFDAAVGRLFKGIIHNLNGVGQAFSMQAELLNMMFEQTDNLLDEISRSVTLEEAQEKSVKLREMLARRADLAKLLTGEVKVLQETMQRTSLLTENVNDQLGFKSIELEPIIMMEIEFLKSDGFFKHKIKKELALAEDIRILGDHQIQIHQILAVLLENASQALAANIASEAAPHISITSATDGVYAEVRITDNGPGIDAGNLEKIFEPFFTTRENHLGLGLYLARVMAVNSGCFLDCESSAGRTCFTLKIPVKGGHA